MTYYQKDDYLKLIKDIKKSIVFNVVFGIISITIFIIFCILSTYENHFVYQILGGVVLYIFAALQIYFIDAIYFDKHQLKSHYHFMLLSDSETYKCKIVNIGEIITVSNRIKARPVEVLIQGKTITSFLLENFDPTFKINDTLNLNLKNRFIFSYEVISDE